MVRALLQNLKAVLLLHCLLSLLGPALAFADAIPESPCAEDFSVLGPAAHQPTDPAAFLHAHQELVSPRLREEIDRSGLAYEPERLQNVVNLIKRFNDFQFADLENSMERSGLDEATLETLKAKSKGFLSARDLFGRNGFEGGYALGLTSKEKMKLPTAIGREMGMEDWEPAYARHQIDWRAQRNHTDLFMHAITAENKPIVMFIPPNFLDHSRAGITRDEFNWLLAHPDKMKNVTFVFGAYDLVKMPNASTQVEVLRRQSVTGDFEDYLEPAIRAFRKKFAPRESR